jgi:hypothetical protein
MAHWTDASSGRTGKLPLPSNVAGPDSGMDPSGPGSEALAQAEAITAAQMAADPIRELLLLADA